jgi:hypothetical protein
VLIRVARLLVDSRALDRVAHSVANGFAQGRQFAAKVGRAIACTERRGLGPEWGQGATPGHQRKQHTERESTPEEHVYSPPRDGAPSRRSGLDALNVPKNILSWPNSPDRGVPSAIVWAQNRPAERLHSYRALALL